MKTPKTTLPFLFLSFPHGPPVHHSRLDSCRHFHPRSCLYRFDYRQPRNPWLDLKASASARCNPLACAQVTSPTHQSSTPIDASEPQPCAFVIRNTVSWRPTRLPWHHGSGDWNLKDLLVETISEPEALSAGLPHKAYESKSPGFLVFR